MKGKKIIGILIIILGIGIFAYPIVRQTYSAYRQNQLKEAFHEILKDKEEEQKKISKEECTVTVFLTPEPSKEALDLEEQQQTEDDQTADNIKDRLQGQVVLGLIEIEKLDLIYAIVEGTKDNNLGVAIGHMSNTAQLGEVGNCVLAGHRGGTSGPYFKEVDKLVAGDEIQITTTQGEQNTYIVTELLTVGPNDMWVTSQKDKTQKLLTLITCQDHGTKRLIVRAACKKS